MIYQVYARHFHGDVLLGIAEGEAEDILAYYNGQKGIELNLVPIKPIKIKKGTAKKLAEINKRQSELCEELHTLTTKAYVGYWRQ